MPLRKSSPESKNSASSEGGSKGYVNNLLRTFGQGVLFEFEDEAEAFLRTQVLPKFLGGTDKPYKEVRDEIRASIKDFAKKNPKTAFAANVGGAVASAVVPVGAALRAGSLGGRVLAGSATGAGLGGVAGAGLAEEVSDIPESVTAGVATGAALGAGLPLAGYAVRKTVVPLAKTISELAKSAVTNPQKRAINIIAKRLEEGGVTDETLAKLKAEVKPMALADLPPAGVIALSKLISQMGDKGAEFAKALDVRQFGEGNVEGALSRITKDVEKAGLPTQDITAARKGIDVIKREKGGEAYKKSFDFAITPQLRSQLSPIFSRPSMKNIVRDARNLAAEGGDSFGGNTLDSIDMKGLNYIVKALGSRSRSMMSENPDMALAIGKTRKDLTTLLDGANPDYKKARSLYADAFDKEEALEFGLKFRRLRPEEIKAKILDFGDDQLESFRTGVSQRLMDEIEGAKAGGNIAKILTDTQRKLGQLKASLPKGKYKKFVDSLEKESTMAASRGRYLSGSQTGMIAMAERQIAEEGLGAADDALQSMKRGGASGLIGSMIERAMPLRQGLGANTREEIGKRLFATQPAQRASAIEEIMAKRAGRPSVQPPRLPASPPPIGLRGLAREGLPATSLFAPAQEIASRVSPSMPVPSLLSSAEAGQVPVQEIYTAPNGLKYAITEQGATLLGE
jgi:hypothetical protein